MKSYIFDVVIKEDRFESGERAFSASCPALKGCRSWGHTYEEALANIREAIELYIEDLVDAGKPVPTSQKRGVTVRDKPAVAVNVR
ncbi:MAG: type II toxin-antitoxin system HicB family antitoxin [Chloroflexi bacterium]|nr:type II toxin-antitoxin system HicB family antitoxin [Chloroflexota bacterium]